MQRRRTRMLAVAAFWVLLGSGVVSTAQQLPVTDLGTLGGANSWVGNNMFSSPVDDSGQVVGASETSSGESHAFLWTAEDGIRDLGTLGGAASYPRAINRAGQVVGMSWTVTGETHAFLCVNRL